MLLRTIAASLLAAAPAFAQIQAQPSGDGNPKEITCRASQAVPGSRLPGPQICKTNEIWAQYARDGVELSADGSRVQPSEKARSINPQACHNAPGGSSGSTTQAMQTNFSSVCF